MSIFATWEQPEGAAGSIRWVEDFRLAMLPFTKGVYVNTPDLSIKNWPDAYFSCNFDRLMEVKAKYDPKNILTFRKVFRFFKLYITPNILKYKTSIFKWVFYK